MESKFKVWDEKNRKWKNPDNFFINSEGKLVELFEGIMIENPTYDLVKATSLTDEWEDNPNGIIYEGDYVYLYAWKDMVGIAEVIFDEEEDCWTYDMIAGNYREDPYGRYHKQSPNVVGNKYNNPDFRDSKDWIAFLKEEQEKANLEYKKKELDKKRKKLNDENKSFQNQIKEIKEKQKLNENKLKELKKK